MASFFDLPIGRGNEFNRILVESGLSGEDAMRVLRDHSLGKVMIDALHAVPIAYKPPSWYVEPKLQIKRIKQFLDRTGCVVPIPNPPAKFTPHTSTEVLMLAVYLPDDSLHVEGGVERTNRVWWDFIELPKVRWEQFKSDSMHLRLVPKGKRSEHIPRKHHTGIRWVAFDPNANQGKSPRSCWNDQRIVSTLASAEVLMAAALFPRWALSMSNVNSSNSPYPNMSGYQFFDEGGWNMTLCFVPWVEPTLLKLNVNLANSYQDNWSNPTVREL